MEFQREQKMDILNCITQSDLASARWA